MGISCSQQCLEPFTWLLLSWGLFCSQGCERFASPEVRPRFTLHFLAAASLFPWGCCYPFKNKHPRNSLLKQASPLQIQLYSFSWVIFSPCCIFGSWGFFTEFIKKHGPATGKARGIFTLLTPSSAPEPLLLRCGFFFPLWKPGQGRQRQLPPGRQGVWGSSHTGQDRMELGPPRESWQEIGKGFRMWKWETKLRPSCWLR